MLSILLRAERLRFQTQPNHVSAAIRRSPPDGAASREGANALTADVV